MKDKIVQISKKGDDTVGLSESGNLYKLVNGMTWELIVDSPDKKEPSGEVPIVGIDEAKKRLEEIKNAQIKTKPAQDEH